MGKRPLFAENCYTILPFSFWIVIQFWSIGAEKSSVPKGNAALMHKSGEAYFALSAMVCRAAASAISIAPRPAAEYPVMPEYTIEEIR